MMLESLDHGDFEHLCLKLYTLSEARTLEREEWQRYGTNTLSRDCHVGRRHE